MIAFSADVGFKDERIKSIYTEPNMGINNISAHPTDIINKQPNYETPFLLGVSNFKDCQRYSDDVAQVYISSQIADDKGHLASDEIFDFNVGENSKLAIIFFDIVNNIYPNEILINYKDTFKLNSPVCVIDVGKYGRNIAIIISDLNKPYASLVVQSITTFWHISPNEIVSIECEGQDRSSAELPSWGIKSNKANIEIYDRNKIISKVLNTKCPTFIYLENNDIREQLGVFYINSVGTTGNFATSKVELLDILSTWTAVECEGYPMPSLVVEDTPMLLLERICRDCGVDTLKMDNETEEVFEKITLVRYFVEAGSLWNVMVQVCEALGCYIYCDTDGNPTIKFNGGR